jgi:predicted nucleotidyltransferase component of viral defense system
MDAFLTYNVSDRRRICETVSDKIDLQAESVEKDFWVCWTLRELFALPEVGSHLTFKGGTSLSKCWKLISRFSEDIDVVIDRDFLGFGGEKSPEASLSKKQRAKRLEDLKSACQSSINKDLRPALNKRFHVVIPKDLDWTLTSDPDDVDQQTLLFQYPTVFSSGGYLRPIVKIELGARSDTEPSEIPEIRPFLVEVLPAEFKNGVFKLRAVAPERTFWEKAMLLHEETYRAGDVKPKARLARHYYDLWCLIQAKIGDKALSDTGLFYRVAAHRAVFFRKKKEAQESLKPGSLRLLPQEAQQDVWKRDYEAMREAMIFGEAPDFTEILRVVGDFERRFNTAA